MAGSVRAFLKFNLMLTRNVLRGSTFLNGSRTLYTEGYLGIPAYEKTRILYRTQFMNIEDKFREKMKQVCENDAAMVFTEDLKSMLYLMQNNQSDLELIQKMLDKFHQQNKDLRFGTFIFGPVVMRTLYYLNEPDLAMTVFQDPEKNEFFNQFTSAKLLMTLLYKNNRYADMRAVYETIQNKQIQGMIHPRDSLLLVLAGCYKENTKEALDYGLDLWRDVIAKGNKPSLRCILLLAALSIDQCAPHIALEILSAAHNITNVGIRSLQVSAYADLNKFTEITVIIRAVVHKYPQLELPQQENSVVNRRREYFFPDVIEKVEASLQRESVSLDSEIYQLLKEVRETNLLTDMPVSKYITQSIKLTKKLVQLKKQDVHGEDVRRNLQPEYQLRKGYTNPS